ncbi:2169_t:CDS:10 [Acaulospora morrowiae]|uniref:2169_t:CDS:1 n=1 Tax=Acaulospora morrowiae TaxID=94023 RepID=A0A9N9C6J6_9GLOM|nr:2169_t:CDS:10 [Acaulospora morrowiae]
MSPSQKTVLFMAIGSLGDVLPFINLGVGFHLHGHNVIIAANCRFRKFIESKGLQFREMSWDMQDEWENTDAGRRMVKYSGYTILGSPFMFKFLKQGFEKCYRDAEEVLSGVDFVILGTGSHYMYPECMYRNIPVAYVCFYPYASSSNYIGAVYGRPFDSLQWLPFDLGEKIWKTVDNIAAFWSSIGLLPIYNHRLKELGLQPVSRLPFLPGGAIEYNHIPVLHVSNKNLIRIPQNPRNPLEVQLDYPYMTIQEETAGFVPPTDLMDWLSDGNKPIYFGYGSMHSFSDSTSRVKLWLEVLSRLPELHRAIFSGVSDVKLPELQAAVRTGRVFLVGHVPHVWLFPRVVCVVHHGGAGTSHAVARAGVPSVIVPHFADQPWWASILHRHGVSPNGGINARTVNAERLYEAISAVLVDEKMQERAEELGRKIRSEHTCSPIEKIVSFIEQYWDREKWDVMSLYDSESVREPFMQDEEYDESDTMIKEENASDVTCEKASDSDDTCVNQPLIVPTKAAAFELNGKRAEENIKVQTKIEVESIITSPANNIIVPTVIGVEG